VIKYRVRDQARKELHIHNDLSNAANHFKDEIDRKDAAGLPGVAFDQMACAVMLAFAFEAKLNCLGWKLIPNWNERQSFPNKQKEVFKKLALNPDWSSRPYSSIELMKKFRDTVAHGKPEILRRDQELIVTDEQRSELGNRIDLSPTWTELCTSENVANAFTDLDLVWDDMVSASGKTHYDFLTKGDGDITLLEIINE
jgi:hypothetical protein